MLDGADDIRRKVRRAVTDSDGELRYDPAAKPGLSNLAEIVAALTGVSPAEAMASCRGYGDLKQACAGAIEAELGPVRRRHDELLRDPAELERALARGAERATSVAAPVLQRARYAMGVTGHRQ
jgi:tryptophanyl-tRNA synthetase